MALQTYEIKISDRWEKVKGTTAGMREGWLVWKDTEGCQGMSRPGTWRLYERKVKASQ